MGILSACIGTQPVGTLWIGLLATGIGVGPAIGGNSLLGLLAIAPLAFVLWRHSALRSAA